MHTYIYFPQKELTPDGRDAEIWKLLTLLNTPGRDVLGLSALEQSVPSLVDTDITDLLVTR